MIRNLTLPDFVILGAQKAGTSSLYDYLLQSPQVMKAKTKEVHYFDFRFHRGTEWYSQFFPTHDDRVKQSRQLSRKVITGEATPYYLFHPHAAVRVAATIPRSKLIVLLRDPVARAYSHYQMILRHGLETLSFSDAIKYEAERLSGEIAKMESNTLYYSRPHQIYSYVARGIYVGQLKRYAHWCSRDRMLILSSDDLFEQTQFVCNQVAAFLDIDPWTVKDRSPRNAAAYPPMDLQTEKYLRELFAPHNAELFDWLGTTFCWQ